MPPSAKLAAPWSAAFTAAVVLGIAAFFALADPLWPPAVADLRARIAGIWFKPSEELAQQTSAENPARARTPAPNASAPAPKIMPPEAAFLVPPLQWSHLQVEAALMECVAMLAPIDAEIVPLAPHAYGGCGTPAPVLLRSLGADKVSIDPPLLVNCPVVVALNRWLQQNVQPAARAVFGSPVAKIVASSYACRTPYNLPNDRLSQHAFANAIDVPMFVLADGRAVTVGKGWGPTKRDLIAGKPKLVPAVVKDTEPPEAEEAPKGEDATAKTEDKTGSVVVKASATPDLEAVEPKPAPEPDPLAAPAAKFLRRIHQGACDTFTTVLGPEANDVHRSHFHLDLQERNALNVCR